MSPEVLNVSVAEVALFGITVFPGFGIFSTPVSKPSVLVLLGFLLLTGKVFIWVTELLKKLFADLSVVESVVPFNFKRSPDIGLSPSNVANAKLALTGDGEGTDVNPETGMSRLLLSPESLMVLKPSKLVMDFPGSEGSS